MASSDPEARLAAVRALAARGPQAVDELIAALEDTHFLVWRAAVEALGKIPDPAAAEALMTTFRACVDPGRFTLTDAGATIEAAFASLGHPSVPTLIRSLADPLVEVRALAASALGRIRSPEGVAPLTEVLRDPKAAPRRAAVEALGRIGSPLAVGALREMLEARDPETRALAAGSLGAIGDARAVDALVRRLDDADARVRRAAVEALARIPDASATAALGRLAQHTDRAVRERAAAVLRERGAGSHDPAERAAQAIAAGDFDAAVAEGAPALRPLLDALAGPRERRARAAEALGRLGDPRAAKRLAALLGDKDPGVAREVQWALKGLGEEAAAAVLPRLAADRRETREDAADVLGEIGGAAAVEPLLARLLAAEPFEPYLNQRVDQGFRRTSQEAEYRELGTVVEALGRVLERTATMVPEEVLEQISRIEDFVLTNSPLFGDPEVAGKTILEQRSCEALRQAADAEIERRRS